MKTESTIKNSMRWSMIFSVLAICLSFGLSSCSDEDDPNNGSSGGSINPQEAQCTVEGRTIHYPHAYVWYDNASSEGGPTVHFEFTSIPYEETEEETTSFDDFMIDLSTEQNRMIPTGNIPKGNPEDNGAHWYDCEIAYYRFPIESPDDYFYNETEGNNTDLIITPKDDGYRIEIHNMRVWNNNTGEETTADFVFEGHLEELN